MSQPPRRRTGGFTLVELLVVIGIIALLMSILLPTLGRVRFQSRVTKCASNLRSMAQACNSYAVSNRGKFPTLDMPGTGANLWDVPVDFYDRLREQGVPHEFFFCQVAPENEEAQQQSFTAYANFYIVSYNVWIPRKNGADVIPPHPSSTSTRFTFPQPPTNVEFSGPGNQYDLPRMKNPILTDHVGTGGTPPSDANLAVANSYGLSQVSGHKREEGRLVNMNAAFADGHVETINGGDVRPRYKGNWWNWR
ncbi:MAG TPA: type II secretion system protein [Humisphaera sp.]